MRNKTSVRSNVIELQNSSPMPLSSTPFRPQKIVLAPFMSVIAMVSLLGISSNSWSSFGANAAVLNQIQSFKVVNEFPHDPAAFTQGLLYVANDTLYESTGLYGQSTVRRVDLKTGKIQAIQKLDDSYFGVGLTLLDERLYQLTWLQNIGFIYDQHNFSKFERFTHHMKDGWGLATDGKILFGTDGSSSLYHIDAKTMKVLVEQVVKYNDQEVQYLNELEYINNEVWANVWQSDCIARISPVDGTVVGWILLPELREGLIKAGYNVDVLDGIAWDVEKDRIFVTGTLWPKLYEIKLKPLTKPLPSPIEQLCFRGPNHFVTAEGFENNIRKP